MGLSGPVAGSAPLTADLALTLERTACYGTCPVYKVIVGADNKIIFDGIKYTKVEGKAEDVLNSEKKKLLIDEINKSGFFSLKDSYGISEGSFNCPGGAATDNPTVKLTVKLNDKEKTIVHYLGCSYANEPDLPRRVFPEELYTLENKIDEIIGSKR
jgi:hypothetical protein